MKRAAYKKWWFIGLCLLAGVILFRHLWLWLPAHRYNSLVESSPLVSALSHGDSKRIGQLASTYHYEYQIFDGGQLRVTSDPHLPTLHIFQQASASTGVLPTSLHDQLRATEPYQTRIASHRYIFFAVSPGGAANKLTYVIYGKVL